MTLPPRKTVLGYNPRHKNHRNTVDVKHPECPDRIQKILALLKQKNTLNGCACFNAFPAVGHGGLKQSHSQGFLEEMEKMRIDDQNALNNFTKSSFDSVFMSPGSVEAAQDGVSCCRYLAGVIMEGKYTNGFALVRPPGHHASSDSACGFCLYNNAAQAAEAAFKKGAERILIVDLDVHHGNGTQDIFYNDNRVLYFSIHRHEHGAFWPHLKKSNYDHIGEDKGRGFNVNVPLNETGCGDADYLAIFWNVLWPLAVEFNPQFVIISAGFDSCIGDPLGGMELTPDGYSHLVYHLKALAGGKLLMVLEGGYNHQVTAEAAERCIRVLKDATPVPISLEKPPKESTVTVCLNVIEQLRPFWRCFSIYETVGTGGSYALNIDNDVYSPSDPSSRTNTADIDQSTLTPYKNGKRPEFPNQRPFFIKVDNNFMHFNQEDPDHPECGKRVTSIYDKMSEEGLTAKVLTIEYAPIRCFLMRKKLEDTHERPYLEKLDRFVTLPSEKLQAEAREMQSIYLCCSSSVAANNAAGAVCLILDQIMTKPGPACGFAAVRPPGHHAGIAEGSGFCLLNNVAIATNHARSKYGLKRILILDWDIHHGNGTQEIFDSDPEILYISIHCHNGGDFYPSGPNQDHGYVGSEAGKGFVVNIPWSFHDMGDAEYLAAFFKIVMPIAYEFNPELVMISAGFDAARGDTLGTYKLTPSAYSLMTYQLSCLAGGKILAVLEGGYGLKSVAASAAAVIKTLSNKCPVPDLDFRELKPIAKKARIALRQVLGTQSQYWKSIRNFQVLGNIGTLGTSSINCPDEKME